MPTVTLRPITGADADDLFRMMSDPEAVTMAAFTPDDPGDRERFDAQRARIRANPAITERAILYDGRLAGSIAAFPMDGEVELTYWVDRTLWGRGIAGEALALFLEIVTTRPLRARAASDNLASLRVLQRAGFTRQQTEIAYAAARRTEIEETVLRLDA
jgi:RimJ/RimL family protein N-acetyltransferase